MLCGIHFLGQTQATMEAKATTTEAPVETVSDGTIRTVVTQGNANELKRLLSNVKNIPLINFKGKIVSERVLFL
jgi:hypothetical protein